MMKLGMKQFMMKFRVFAPWIVPAGFALLALCLYVWQIAFSSYSNKEEYFYNQKQYDKAIPYLKIILKMEKTELKWEPSTLGTQGTQSLYGYCLLKDHRYTEAIRAFQKAINDTALRSEPAIYDTAEDHYYLGEAMLNTGDRKGAYSEWQKVIQSTQDPQLKKRAKSGISLLSKDYR